MFTRSQLGGFPILRNIRERVLEPRRIRKAEDQARGLGFSLMLAQRPATASFRDLWDAEFRVYSQWGEDGILNFLSEALMLDRPNVLEVGSGNFTECNGRFLADFRSASVVAVDMRTDLIKSMKSMDLYWRSRIYGLQEYAQPGNIREIQQHAESLIGPIDILSLDIDGNDYYVLEQAELSSVSVLVLEYNALFGSGFPVSVPRDDSFDRTEAHYSNLYFGASLPAWIHQLSRRGFTFVGTTRSSVNAFFCADNLVDRLPIKTPDQGSLERYTEVTVREGRNKEGEPTFFDSRKGRDLIQQLPLVDVSSGSAVTLEELGRHYT